MYTMEYCSAIRNDKYPPFASTWMELEGIMLSVVSESEKDKHYMVSLIWGVQKVVKKHVTMENYSAIRNDKYPPFASTWMKLEGITLSEVCQSEKDK